MSIAAGVHKIDTLPAPCWRRPTLWLIET